MNIPASTTFDSAGSGMGAFFGSSLSLAAGQTLSVTGSQTLGGTNPFALTVPTGAVDFCTSALSVTHGSTLNLNGGKITAASLNLNGYPTDFNWSSGTLELTAVVTINAGASSPTWGTLLTLSTGQRLQADFNEQLENTSPTGTFTMNVSGGANTVAGNLTVGPRATLNIISGSVGTSRTIVSTNSKVNFSGGSFVPGGFVISGNSAVTISVPNQTFVLSALSVDNTSKLQLDQSNLIVHNGNVATITPLLAAGFNGGNWNGGKWH